jgi:hypothetical protein
MSTQIHAPRRFPSERLNRLHVTVESWKRVRQIEWRTLLASQLATLFELKRIPDKRLREALKGTVAPLILLSDEAESVARFVFLARPDEALEKMLRHVGIPYAVVSEGLDVEAALNSRLSIALARIPHQDEKSVGNRPEQWLREWVLEVFGPNHTAEERRLARASSDLGEIIRAVKDERTRNYFAYQEVSLSAILPAVKEFECWRNYRCDLLITNRRRVPLLVLEFDGRHHSERRETDSRRDRALASAGIVVLRIASIDGVLRRGDETRFASPHPQSTALRWMLLELVTTFDLRLRDPVDAGLTQDGDLTAEQEAAADLAESTYERQQERLRLLDDRCSPLLNGRAVELGTLLVHHDPDGAIHATVQPRGSARILQTPSFHFSTSVPAGHANLVPEVDVLLDDMVRQYALWMAGQLPANPE